MLARGVFLSVLCTARRAVIGDPAVVPALCVRRRSSALWCRDGIPAAVGVGWEGMTGRHDNGGVIMGSYLWVLGRTPGRGGGGTTVFAPNVSGRGSGGRDPPGEAATGTLRCLVGWWDAKAGDAAGVGSQVGRG